MNLRSTGLETNQLHQQKAQGKQKTEELKIL
jgi:hypothetical protein